MYLIVERFFEAVVTFHEAYNFGRFFISIGS